QPHEQYQYQEETHHMEGAHAQGWEEEEEPDGAYDYYPGEEAHWMDEQFGPPDDYQEDYGHGDY
ncbi:MAG: hypothetical protein HKN45_05325, partial [Flavobacteriales bacterium]|nr:hypothetical protein [Flavobacteriales bacterium]